MNHTNVKLSGQALLISLLIGFTGFASAAKKERIDLLIEGDYIVTMDEAHSVVHQGAVAVNDGQIIAIGDRKTLSQRYRAAERLNGENQIVMPGLINGHSHAAMTLMRGIADDLSLYEWLNHYIFPAEVQFVTADFVRVGTELACWEMIRGGTTTFVDMYYYPDAIAETVERCGMRALISATIIDQKSPDAEDAADSLKNARRYIEQWKHKSARITPILGPHANYTLNIEQLKQTRQLATELGVGISIHMAESRYEMQYAKEHYGQSSVAMFDAIGFLAGPTIAAHMVWPNDSEIETLVKNRVGVIYNPTSNMKTAAGIAPVSKMLKAGVTLGLGTDGAASNNDLDMWEEMRLGALLQKVSGMNPELASAEEMLTMATIGGARAIGLGTEIGSLEVGKRADLIQVSFDDVHHLPVYDVVSHLVYVTDEQDVSNVVIDGKVIMKSQELLTIDKDSVRSRATKIASDIKTRLSAEKSDKKVTSNQNTMSHDTKRQNTSIPALL